MRNARLSAESHQDQRRSLHQYRAQTVGVKHAGEFSGEIERRNAGEARIATEMISPTASEPARIPACFHAGEISDAYPA